MNPDAQSSQIAPNAKKPSLLFLTIAVLAVLAIAALLLIIISHKAPSSSVVSTGKQAIVQVTSDGFVPATLQVKAGTTVVWRNSDSAPHVIASDPYPTDSSLPGLHSKTILPNGSYSFTLAAASTVHYHDNLYPTHNGTVIVIR